MRRRYTSNTMRDDLSRDLWNLIYYVTSESFNYRMSSFLFWSAEHIGTDFLAERSLLFNIYIYDTNTILIFN